MKKLGLASLALATAFALTGCGCSTGTYKPYSYTFGDTEYKCGKNSDDYLDAKHFCDSKTITLKSKGVGYYGEVKEENKLFYKIEDKKLYFRESEDDEWIDTGFEVKSGKLIRTIPGTVLTPKIVTVYKK